MFINNIIPPIKFHGYVYITDNAKTLQDEIANLQEILAAAQEEIKKELQVIRDLQTTHQRLMQDIRALLKSMSKVCV